MPSPTAIFLLWLSLHQHFQAWQAMSSYRTQTSPPLIPTELRHNELAEFDRTGRKVAVFNPPETQRTNGARLRQFDLHNSGKSSGRARKKCYAESRSNQSTQRCNIHSLKCDLWQELCIRTHLVEDDAHGMFWAESEEWLG